ncbi:DNA -binding domain-containing protein [Bradyrhizobium yuanmingense]|uniref:DNA -binding domain-containing protein n=1 Tax=Bradyrhizobium yuanmingense TaxID=108015 RepID=UPI003514EAB0
MALGGAKRPCGLRELPSGASSGVDLPLDRSFEVRLRAAHRLSPALERRPLGPPPLALPILTRHRLILALRAFDGLLKGNS